MANTFQLRVVSLDGVQFTGAVQSVSCRAIDGDLAILAQHRNYITAVGMGTAVIVTEDGTEKRAACIGGMLSMIDNQCSLIVTTWEWDSEIDVDRAERARERAEDALRDLNISEKDYKLASARLRRALVRLNTAG